MIAKRGISGFEMYEYRDEFFGSNVYGRRIFIGKTEIFRNSMVLILTQCKI